MNGVIMSVYSGSDMVRVKTVTALSHQSEVNKTGREWEVLGNYAENVMWLHATG